MGRKPLTKDQVELINQLKTKSAELADYVEELRSAPDLDQRFLSIGVTQLQLGLMSINKAIVNDGTF
jgi:hypothetical protein